MCFPCSLWRLQQPSIEELDQIESEIDAICENSLAQFGDALDGWPHGSEDAKESTWMNTLAEKVENVLWELARRQPARMSYQITSNIGTDRDNDILACQTYACMCIS